MFSSAVWVLSAAARTRYISRDASMLHVEARAVGLGSEAVDPIRTWLCTKRRYRGGGAAYALFVHHAIHLSSKSICHPVIE